jgi:hypothetical protein
MPDEHAEFTGRAQDAPALGPSDPRLGDVSAWLGLLAPAAALTPAAAATVWGLADDVEADALLQLLAGQGLVARAPIPAAGGGQLAAYRPLLPAHASAPAASHDALLDRYRARTRAGACHTLPDDGYIHGALAWHMVQAGRHEELRSLLAEETSQACNGWHQAREALGQVAGYLRDLELACRRAAQQFAAGGPQAGEGLALQCRYALMASSIQGLAPEVPPALLCALVRHGLWSPVQGLAAANAIPEPALRGEAMVHLAAELPANMTGGLIEAALAIEDDEQRARTVLALARCLPEEHVDLALDAIGHLPGEGQRAQALATLAPQLPAAALERALAAALGLQDAGHRLEAVVGLAAHLPTALLPRALAGALEIEDEVARATSLCRLLSRLTPSPGAPPLLPEDLGRQVLAGTWRMRDAAARSEAQAGLAPHLPPYWRDKALAAALDGLTQVHHTRATQLLATLAPHLPPALQQRAIALAEAQPDSLSRLDALAVLLPHLVPEHRDVAAGAALSTALLVRSEAGRAEAIARLAPHLPAPLLEKALVVAQSLAGGRARATALSGMAPFLDRRLAADALPAARTIADERACAMALASLAPLLDAAQQRQALIRVGSLGDERARAIGLVGLAPVLAPGLLPGALAEARRIIDVRALTVALAGVAPAFDEAGRAGLLAVAADIADPAMRLEALLGLLPCLSRHQRAGAIEAAWRAIQVLGDEQAQVAALSRLVPHLAAHSGEVGEDAEAQRCRVLDEALRLVTPIQDPERRCRALVALVPHLTGLPREKALAALPQDGQAPAALLLDLIPHLPAEIQARAAGQILAAVRRLPRPARSRVLGGLVPYLHRQQLPEALAAARVIGDGDERLQALLALAPLLDDAGRREVLVAVGQVPEPWKRAALLAALLKHLAPAQAAGHLSGLVPEILDLARQTGDCWPGTLALTALARMAGDEERAAILHEARQAALALGDACCRIQAMARLAPHLHPEAQPGAAAEILQEVSACRAGPGAHLLGQALAAVAPFLPAAQVPAAWTQAQRLLARVSQPQAAVPRAWERRPGEDPLLALARRLPEEAVRGELASAGAITRLHLRSQTLSALAVRLGELGLGQEAVSATRPIEPLPYQVDALLHLAPHLSLPWLREALTMARDLGRHAHPATARIAVRLAELGEGEEAWRTALDISGKCWQAEALARMAPHLPARGREAAYARSLDIACEVHDPGERLRFLARLLAELTRKETAPPLPGDLSLVVLEKILRAAVAVKEATIAVRRRLDQRASVTPLAPLAEPLAALFAEPAGPEAGAALRRVWLADQQGERLLDLLGRQPRPVAVLELAVLAPLLARLAGPAALREILAAVQHVARWWP